MSQHDAALVDGMQRVALGGGADEAAAFRPATARRGRRLRQLCAYIGVPDAGLSSMTEVAERVLHNMAMTLPEQSSQWDCPTLSRILQQPLPFDSANGLKQSLMLELVPPTGDDLLFSRVWTVLASAMTASAQATPIALVTGVSGMGKTKLAYDIGLHHAFVVFSRIVEQDNFTPPWSTFRGFALELVRTACVGDAGLPPLSERMALKATLIVLLAAHMQYAVCVSLAATECAQFSDAVRRAGGVRAQTASDRARVLREVVLRAQRNGLAYQHVKAFFQTAMQRLLADPSAMADDGTLTLSVNAAHAFLEGVVRSAYAAWDGAFTRIVFAHDEVQGLLDVPGLPPNVFDGVFSDARAPRLGLVAPPSLHRGCFYGLLAAIREVLGRVTCAHLLLGNNLDLSDDIVNQHSPAQGVTTTFDEAVNLTVEHIKVLLAHYLTPDALRGATTELLAPLRGRALFISKFWSALIAASSVSTPEQTPAELVASVLDATYKAALREAEARIERLWLRTEPSSRAQVPCAIVRCLFHALVMKDGVVDSVGDMRHELRDCINRGVLNARGETDRIVLDGEPLTAQALKTVGLRRLASNTDGIMQMLSDRMTGPAGGETADQGVALEQCFSWALVRRFLAAPDPTVRLSLGELLAPFFALDVSVLDVRGTKLHGDLLPAMLSDLSVCLDKGIRCDGDEWKERCPLELLVLHPNALLHHTRDEMAGADIIFRACFRDGRSRIVLLQLKNRVSGTLATALPSVNLGRWYTDRRRLGHEQPAHAHMREILDANPDWALPVRVLVTSRRFQARVLYLVAWLNRHFLEDSPLVCLQATAVNLGADIFPLQEVEYGLPEDVRVWWPTAVRHTTGPVPQELPALLPGAAPSVTLSVTLASQKLSCAESLDELVEVARQAARETTGEVGHVVRHTGQPTASVTVTFSHLVPALLVTEQCAGTAGSWVTAAFA